MSPDANSDPEPGFWPEEALRAEALARTAHRDQVEKYGGGPYVEHLARVAALVREGPAKSVAWLHDIMEDTPLGTYELIKAGVHPQVVEAVRILTRGRESYQAYIASIDAANNPLAREVKLADLQDHLRMMDAGRAIPLELKRRYYEALRLLRGGDPAYQAQPCGCDPGAAYLCTLHAQHRAP